MSWRAHARPWTICCLLCGAGCASSGPVSFLGSASPYEAYADRLQQIGLDVTALGVDWTRAGERALTTPAPVTLPFLESTFHAADAPSAHAYRLTLSRGRRLVVDVQVESVHPARVFVDLFEVDDNGQPDRVTSLEEGDTTLTYDVRQDGDFLLRVQPELLRDVRVTLTQRTESTLRFPVTGLTSRAVQSTFGASRDRDTRSHEGIDIFASRGTPVVAVTDGVARPSTNGLGGNVVWLRGDGHTFYYAHLDRWAIENTVRVTAGEVLGYVGNTGNARTTAPHLHFGIYAGRPIDPLPFVAPDDPPPPSPATPVERLGQRVRVTPVRTPLRAGPTTSTPTLTQLERATVARAVGVAGRMIRVALPDATGGYVAAAAVVPADPVPARRRRLAARTPLRTAPLPAAPVVATFEDAVAVDVLGSFAGHVLVRTPGQQTGWVVEE